MSEFPARRRLVSLILGASALVTFASTGCVAYHHHSHGPVVRAVSVPPRSAAHGYVHHYRDHILVFDHSWNGYWVRGHPHHYFYVDHYYRWHDGGWQKARRFRGPWVSVERRALPPGLHRRVWTKEHRQAEKERREAARERRDAQREVARERREEQHEAAKEHREVAKERRDAQREVARERREERHEVAKERREVAKERRDAQREVARERREERREATKEHREVAKERRDARREVARERREERREIAATAKTPQTTKPPGDRARGSAKRRTPPVPEADDEELPANQELE